MPPSPANKSTLLPPFGNFSKNSNGATSSSAAKPCEYSGDLNIATLALGFGTWLAISMSGVAKTPLLPPLLKHLLVKNTCKKNELHALHGES